MKDSITKILLVLSPFIVTLITFFVYDLTRELRGGGEALGVMMLVMIIFGIPFVALVGLVFSFLTRKRPNAKRLSMMSYLIPAIITWLCVVPILFT